MLFDLRSGKRRRVVQIVFGFLAFIFVISFVGFGIGSDVSGGIFDAIGGGGGGSVSEQFKDQIEDAEKQLEEDPEDERALRDLALYRAQSGRVQLAADEETGQPIVTEEARSEWEAAAEAWDRYLETDPKSPDSATAAQMVQAFYFLSDAEGAATAQRIVAEATPGANNFFNLALYLYADYQFAPGDRAAASAVAEAEPSERASLRKQLEQISKQAAKQKKALEKLPAGGAGGEGALENPFGGLGPSGTAPPVP